MLFDETIIAKASAPGPGFRGIVRMSGSVSSLPSSFFEPEIRSSAVPFVRSGTIFPWGPERPIPARIYYWPENHGYTGQEALEIHTFGSPPLLDAVVAVLCDSNEPDGHRPRLARPGEFTLRAFLAGRLDLAQAEAVLGVIDARSKQNLEVALNQLAGGIASSLKPIRESLFDALAHLEAGFDFAEEDIEFISSREIRCVLVDVLRRTVELRRRMDLRKRSDEKPKVVLAGPPNAGKSTLFNRLLNENRSIASPVPGTTRDYLEAEISFDGISCILLDTAGLDPETPESEIDRAAQQYARELSDRADLLIYCSETMESGKVDDERTLHVLTKGDLRRNGNDSKVTLVSARTGEGIDRLEQMIADRLKRQTSAADVVPDTALRCGESLDAAVRSLRHALELSESGLDESLLAAEMFAAVNALGLVDGTVHSDDILDRIFSRFCVGK